MFKKKPNFKKILKVGQLKGLLSIFFNQVWMSTEKNLLGGVARRGVLRIVVDGKKTEKRSAKWEGMLCWGE